MNKVANVCIQFLKEFLFKKCPKNIYSRFWFSILQDFIRTRYEIIIYKMEFFQEDLKNYSINYNRYYIDNITKIKIRRYDIDGIIIYKPVPDCNSQSHTSVSIDITAVINKFFRSIDPNLDKHNCENVLDCLFSIYKIYF